MLTLLSRTICLPNLLENNLAMTDKRLLCSWDWGDDCKRWFNLLSESSPPKTIGRSPFRFRKDVITKLEDSINKESDEVKKKKFQVKLEKWVAFRNCVLRNINRSANQDEEFKHKDIIVARHHFPHECQEKKPIFKMIKQNLSSKEAQDLNIPLDRHTQTNHNGKTCYFLAPVVAKNEMQNIVKLKRRGGRSCAMREVVKSANEAKKVTPISDNLRANEHFAFEMKSPTLNSYPVELSFTALLHQDEDNAHMITKNNCTLSTDTTVGRNLEDSSREQISLNHCVPSKVKLLSILTQLVQQENQALHSEYGIKKNCSN